MPIRQGTHTTGYSYLIVILLLGLAAAMAAPAYADDGGGWEMVSDYGDVVTNSAAFSSFGQNGEASAAFEVTAPVSSTPPSTVYAYLSIGNRVALIDTRLFTVTGNIDVGAAGCDWPESTVMSPGGEYVYVACSYNNVAVIETVSNTVVTTYTGPFPEVFSHDGNFALTTGSFAVNIMDTTTYSVTHTIPFPDGVRNLIIHPYLDIVYVASSGAIHVIDLQTFDTVAIISASKTPYILGISPDGQWLLVRDHRENGWIMIDAVNYTVHTRIGNVGQPTHVVFDPDGSVIYTGDVYCGCIRVIDSKTFVDPVHNLITATGVTDLGIWGIGIEENHPTAVGLQRIRAAVRAATNGMLGLIGVGMCLALAFVWKVRRTR